MEHLVFRVGETSLSEVIFPLLINYCDNLPKLKHINLKIDRDFVYVGYIAKTIKNNTISSDKTLHQLETNLLTCVTRSWDSPIKSKTHLRS